MAKKIWKFSLDVTSESKITMPAGAQILCVQNQHGHPCIWALVDPENDREERSFFIHGTGYRIQEADDISYIGTFQQANGDLVWHVFEPAQ